jgi:hypothetical protein
VAICGRKNCSGWLGFRVGLIALMSESSSQMA